MIMNNSMITLCTVYAYLKYSVCQTVKVLVHIWERGCGRFGELRILHPTFLGLTERKDQGSNDTKLIIITEEEL